MLAADYLVVGSGLTGATIARILADAGREVVVVERRAHLGGNVHDTLHPSGILIHTYGPHYFRTKSAVIWKFVRRFADFYRYEASVFSYVDGRYECWPPQERQLTELAGPGWSPAFSGHPRNFEEAALSLMPAIVYQKFVKGYTEKQWGVPATTLDAGLAKRFDIRPDNDCRLSLHKYQGLPVCGYAAWMSRMFDGIPVVLNTDYLQYRDALRSRKMLIYTGAVDEFCTFKYGKLKYRGQLRRHQYFPDQKHRLPGPQVNYPDPVSGDQIRAIEWKHLLRPADKERVQGTVTTEETPFTPTDTNGYEYPFPNARNHQLYQRYFAEVSSSARIIVCGRLGHYRYYDMDQAIGVAMKIAGALVGARTLEETYDRSIQHMRNPWRQA